MMFRMVRDFFEYYFRLKMNSSSWSKEYKRYKAGEITRPPLPAVLQIIPTENCNLRCPMCNQWGDSGYLPTKQRDVGHMPFEDLKKLLDHYEKLVPNYALSVHGGEPFFYNDIELLFQYLKENPRFSLFSTNGFYLEKYASKLAAINKKTVYLLSIDGTEKVHDQIRGKGVFNKIVSGVAALRDECKKQKTGLPKIFINYCVCEFNPEEAEGMIEVAKMIGAQFVNYNLRWFLPESSGLLYNEILKNEFEVTPTNAWRGWMCDQKFETIDKALDHIFALKRQRKFNPFPPYISMIPKNLELGQAKTFYHDFAETFGVTSCVMPSYWARVHSNGDLLYCPGHPDIIPGNVFNEPFEDVYYNNISQKIREYTEKKLFPICNRCCGLFMTYLATSNKKFQR